MDWVVVQLTPWALKHMRAKELGTALKKRLRKNLEFFYPAEEDVYGKYEGPYNEYLFLQYLEGVDYKSLEETEEFKRILWIAPKVPALLTDEEVSKVRQQVEKRADFCEGDLVSIHSGALRGNQALVREAWNDQVQVTVYLGVEEIDAAFPSRWVRKVATVAT